MKICFLNKTLDVRGGIGRYGREIIENLTESGKVEATVLTEDKSGYKSERAVLLKSNLLKNLPNIFINAFKVRRYLKKCDIIHAFDGYPYGVIAALANIGLNKKLIINAVGTYSILPLAKPIKKTLLKWAYQRADVILCISSFTEKQILKKIKPRKNIVINLGVDYNKFSEQGKLIAKNTKEKTILSVAGGLKRRKGFHISIPAVGQVKKERPDLKIKYYIIGSQSDDVAYFNKIKELVKEHNLEAEVIFLENLSDQELIKLYYSADLFVLVSVNIGNDFEGFGLVYLEAGACGLPAIGTYDCGAEDAIIDGVTGLLVPQNDVQKTAGVILKLLDNPEFAQKLGANGREKAQQMSWDKIVKRYIQEYEKLL